MERLEKTRPSHPIDKKKLQEKLASFGKDFRSHGLEAVASLSWYMGEKERPLRIRMYAAAFLGLIRESSAYPALKKRVLDKKENIGLRTAALSSAGSLNIPPHLFRNLLDEAAAPKQPEELIREALSQAAEIGTNRIEQTLKNAKRHGPAPRGLPQGSAAHAVRALGHAPSSKAESALFQLLRYYKKKSPLRITVLTALSRQRLLLGPAIRRKPLPLDRGEIKLLTQILFEEKGRPALQAARFLGAVGDSRVTLDLIHALKTSHDPAVITEVAQTLAAIGDTRAAAPLAALSKNIIKDRRFAAKPQHPDPREYALRIQKASESFAHIKDTPARAPRPVLKQQKTSISQASTRNIKAEPLPFYYEGWPGAGTPKLAWNATVSRLHLRKSPSKKAPLLYTLRIKKDSLLAFDDSRVITHSAGRVRTNKNTRIEGYLMGPLVAVSRKKHEGTNPLTHFVLKEGDSLEVLSYRADGRCFIRWDYQVYLADCPQDDRAHFSVLRPEETQWWLHMRVEDKAGWFYAEQEGIDFLPRW